MKSILLVICALIACGVCSPAGAANVPPADPEVDRIYQFFAPAAESAARPNLGAYLWIPPNTPKIRAVIVGMHNGLPINVMQSAAVRAVCRRHGIAQVLMTPWAKEVGSVMLRNLTYDVTDPQCTAVYDGYMQRLAELSGHAELLEAPIVPMAHSAFCDFPFQAAMRRPERCLAALPIKAGLADLYAFFAPGGKALHPDPNLCLRNVPILFIASASQETVNWSAYPHAMEGAAMSQYRRDRDDNFGDHYEPRNELFGISWEMMSGHFDMLPRDYQFVADWLDAVATARLPDRAGTPLKNLMLRDGWLIPARVPAAGELPREYPAPAPYAQYKWHRNQALWYPTEALARAMFELGRDEPRKQIELFTFLDPKGEPIDLAHTPMATMPDPHLLLHDDGLLTLTTHHFTAPPQICTVKDQEHSKHPEQPHAYANVLFPGRTTLPTSDIPLRFDANSGGFRLANSETFKDARGVSEARFTLRLTRHRMNPDAGFVMSFVRVAHEGDSTFAATGRTCQISLAPTDVVKGAAAQTIDFPRVPDVPGTSARVILRAKSSAGRPVEYFVLNGPGVIREGAFVPAEIPAGCDKPIEVTIGAYEVGVFKSAGGIQPAATVYRTFHLTPPF